MVKAMKF